ncbi:MAG: MBL fold metallo-hydrolase [Sarcina sp.]
MLKFLGIGSAFNTKLGNNSSFIFQGKTLILIDCGGTIFHKLRTFEFLDKAYDIYILLSHTHPDHFGSLGEVIFYTYYMLNKKINLIYQNKNHINKLLSLVGVKDTMYNLLVGTNISFSTNDFKNIEIEIMPAKHSSSVDAYSFILNINGEKIYYSGDACEIPQTILDRFYKNEINKIYQDTCGKDYVGNGHLYIGKLCNYIDYNYRDRVYCMHLDEILTQNIIESHGFNVAKVYEFNKSGI